MAEPANSAIGFHQLSVTIEGAVLRERSSFLKPNPYVEFLIDEKSSRKTEFVKNTYQPKWNEEFTVLVTPQSTLHFRILDHSSFRKDTLIGEKRLNLFQLLTHYHGKCDNLELNLDLLSSDWPHPPTKVCVLTVVLNGLQIDLSTLPPAPPGAPSIPGVSTPSGVTNSTSVMQFNDEGIPSTAPRNGGNATQLSPASITSLDDLRNGGALARMRLNPSDHSTNSIPQQQPAPQHHRLSNSHSLTATLSNGSVALPPASQPQPPPGPPPSHLMNGTAAGTSTFD